MLNRKTCSNDVLSSNIYGILKLMSEYESENVIDRPRTLRQLTEYDGILQDIRDMRVLSKSQLYYLRTSPSNLLKIVELYNFVIQNVNEVCHNISALNST